MNRLLAMSLLCLMAAAATAAEPVTTGTLLNEMKDLGVLARWPQASYHNIQFSSYDRRSTTAEAPDWFSNSDGFGGEPIPGFLKTLREPRDGKPGLYLVAEVQGPGALVRSWSAAMEGVLRVYLDPGFEANAPSEGTLVWEGPSMEFLTRRSAHCLKRAGVALNTVDAFTQWDADYLPMPFVRGLRIVWEGMPGQAHFYHIQVRRYVPGTVVETFDAQKDLKKYEAPLRQTVAALTKPSADPRAAKAVSLTASIAVGQAWSWSSDKQGAKSAGAIRELRVRIQSERRDEALRGCLLRLAFDGSQRPQVEAPLGDFFASGPGVNPFGSLPFTVEADGTMICRFVMPYRESVRLEVVNHSPAAVSLDGRLLLSPWTWDDNSMYFHAKWRIDPDLLAGVGVVDMPYTVAIGRGVLVGCAVQVMNPSGIPTNNGNWWGEGDEKILVDGETTPSIFGTGSEDYFNYAWSSPELFAHPYCGQPLDSGPETSGYISNHRFQIIDAVPFDRSLAFLMELWTHNRTPGLSYARIAYLYARPGLIDDHRALMPADLKIQPLPVRPFVASNGADRATCFHLDQLQPETTAGRVETVGCPVATQLRVAQWQAEKGAKLTLRVPVAKEGRWAFNLMAVYQPHGARVRVLMEGKPVADVRLFAEYGSRIVNKELVQITCPAGTQDVVLECLEPGVVGLDGIWIQPR